VCSQRKKFCAEGAEILLEKGRRGETKGGGSDVVHSGKKQGDGRSFGGEDIKANGAMARGGCTISENTTKKKEIKEKRILNRLARGGGKVSS